MAITGYDTALPFSAQHVLALYRCLVVDIVWVKSSSKGRRLDVDGETPQPYPHVDDVFEGMVDVEFKVLLEVVPWWWRLLLLRWCRDNGVGV